MKNIISLVLAMALIFVTLAPSDSLASSDKDLKQAIERAKKSLNISKDYESFEYSIFKEEGITLYNLNWKNTEQTKFISATIDSKGFIMNYDSYSNDESYESKLAKISEKEGKKISEDFIKAINPQIKENIKYKGNDRTDGPYMNRYYFNFVRTENGIPYTNNMANINVDRITGQVKNFYITWDRDLNFPNDKEIISKEQADKIYKEKIRFEMIYKYDYTNGLQEPRLVYSIIEKNKSIDAKTGEIIDYSNNYLYDHPMGILESTDKVEDSDKELSQEELEAITNSKQIISQAEVEKLARENINISDAYDLSHLSLFKENNQYRWYLNFNKQDKSYNSNIDVSIDAKTREIIHFNKYDEDSPKEDLKYTREKALKIAKEYLNKTQKEKLKQIEYIDTGSKDLMFIEENMSDQHSFKFVRKVNGILFEGDGFDISVDARDGQITRYSTSWYGKELPLVKDVVSKGQAYETFFSKARLELQYIKVPGTKESKDTKLAYSLSGGYKLDVDAQTGKIIDLYNNYENKNQEKPNYSDIENTMAKKQIETLKDINIYLPGDKFEPKKEIRQEDFLYLLAISRENYLSYGNTEDLYKMLMGQNIVKKGEKSPDSKISRQEAIKYIIRSLGYSKIADIDGIYKLDFKDSDSIDKELKGYVALAKGLKIVNGTKDGSFKPKDILTREQAILLIYNMLDAN